jgi:D-sedoheptulose 7-phosphate isomerase
VFVQQLASFVQPEDVVIAISASGNSKNVLSAIDLANQVGATTIGFTGFNGGVLGTMVDINMHVPSRIIEQVEDIHLMFEHIIVKALRENVEELTFPGQSDQNGHIPYAIQPKAAGLDGKHGKTPSFELLYDISKELNRPVTGFEQLQRTLQISLQNVGGNSGSILQLDPSGEVAKVATAYDGRFDAPDISGISDLVQKGLAGWVVKNRQAALVPNTREDPRWLLRMWEQSDGLSRSAVSVPLLERDRVSGVLTLVQKDAGLFSQDHLVLLASIAVFVSFNNYQQSEFELK